MALVQVESMHTFYLFKCDSCNGDIHIEFGLEDWGPGSFVIHDKSMQGFSKTYNLDCTDLLTYLHSFT